jgi:hypothetical protein
MVALSQGVLMGTRTANEPMGWLMLFHSLKSWRTMLFLLPFLYLAGGFEFTQPKGAVLGFEFLYKSLSSGIVWEMDISVKKRDFM